MRFIARFFAIFGVLIMVGAAMMVIDSYATPERKAGFQNEFNDALDSEAERYEHSQGRTCLRRRSCDFVGSTAHMIVSLRDGLFLNVPFSVDDALPQPPEGWSAERYENAHGETFFNTKIIHTALVVSTINDLLLHYEKAGQGINQRAAATYKKDDRMILLSISVSLSALRAARKGQLKLEPIKGELLTKVSGIPVKQQPQFSNNSGGIEPIPVTYRYFVLDMDKQVTVRIVAHASDADILALLEGLDVVGIIDTLPLMPAEFVPDMGVEWFEDANTDLPEATVAMQAYQMIQNDQEMSKYEKRLVKAISTGRLTSWAQVQRYEPESLEKTPLLITLLGP